MWATFPKCPVLLRSYCPLFISTVAIAWLDSIMIDEVSFLPMYTWPCFLAVISQWSQVCYSPDNQIIDAHIESDSAIMILIICLGLKFLSVVLSLYFQPWVTESQAVDVSTEFIRSHPQNVLLQNTSSPINYQNSNIIENPSLKIWARYLTPVINVNSLLLDCCCAFLFLMLNHLKRSQDLIVFGVFYKSERDGWASFENTFTVLDGKLVMGRSNIFCKFKCKIYNSWTALNLASQYSKNKIDRQLMHFVGTIHYILSFLGWTYRFLLPVVVNAVIRLHVTVINLAACFSKTESDQMDKASRLAQCSVRPSDAL